MFQKYDEVDDLNVVIEAAIKKSDKQKKPASPFAGVLRPGPDQFYSEKAVLDYIKSLLVSGATALSAFMSLRGEESRYRKEACDGSAPDFSYLIYIYCL